MTRDEGVCEKMVHECFRNLRPAMDRTTHTIKHVGPTATCNFFNCAHKTSGSDSTPTAVLSTHGQYCCRRLRNRQREKGADSPPSRRQARPSKRLRLSSNFPAAFGAVQNATDNVLKKIVWRLAKVERKMSPFNVIFHKIQFPHESGC